LCSHFCSYNFILLLVSFGQVSTAKVSPFLELGSLQQQLGGLSIQSLARTVKYTRVSYISYPTTTTTTTTAAISYPVAVCITRL